MPPALQPKLLRVLQEREFDRVGGTRAVAVNIRVIATTNRSLLQMVQEGRFRADLYYRLNVIPLSLPPLRERREDIPELVDHFLRLYSDGSAARRLPPDFMARLIEHSWPGNVRELANCIRRLTAFCPSGEIPMSALNELDLVAQNSPIEAAHHLHSGATLRDLEREALIKALVVNHGNRSRVAESLGISLRTVRNKIRDYGLPPRRNYAHD
jgi:DNA-binding NtrC family response regulator